MSAHNHGSKSRANMYSEDRCTNWTEFDPAWTETQAVYKKFDGRISKRPDFPKIIALPTLEGFLRPCSPEQVESKLRQINSEFIEGLRAVFILGGTQKQLMSWGSSVTTYGHYWRGCIFLHAYPSKGRRFNLTQLRAYFIRNVLVHEIGHHVDQQYTTTKERERFAKAFAKEYG